MSTCLFRTIPSAWVEKEILNALLADLKSCSTRVDHKWARTLHAKAVETRNCTNISIAMGLIKIYTKCNSMEEAHSVFRSIPKQDLLSWTALIMGYAQNEQGNIALNLFSTMKANGYVPNRVTYLAVIKACTSLTLNGSKSECLERGKQIHLEIGFHLDLYLENALTDMYSKCGSMKDAREVFDSIKQPDVVSWTSLILGYAENGDGHAALDAFSRMKSRGCVLEAVTYVGALKACTSLAVAGHAIDGLKRGREIHSEIGSHMNHCIQSTLIHMYANCRSMVEARSVFDSIRKLDVVCWNALLLGYAENGLGLVALGMFTRMKDCGFIPNYVTYVAVLKACTSLAVSGDCIGCLERGRNIHAEIGPHLNHHVHSTLIDMYAKSGSMEDARRVFDSIKNPVVVTWSALLLGYAENGEGRVVLDLFSNMKDRGCVPNSVTYLAVIKACGLTKDLILGRKFHSEIKEFSVHIVTCLVDFYAKCGRVVEACEVFDDHPEFRAVPTWNALLAGYGSFGDSDSVFKLFHAMQDQGFRPDDITFLCLLLCCIHAGLVEKAREFFEAMPVYGVTRTGMHYTCMVDALGRANQLSEAMVLVQRMPCSPVAETWRALLDACCKWRNMEIGNLVFQSLVVINKHDDSAYVLMSQMYGSTGLIPCLVHRT